MILKLLHTIENYLEMSWNFTLTKEGVANGKSETAPGAETTFLNSERETLENNEKS